MCMQHTAHQPHEHTSHIPHVLLCQGAAGCLPGEHVDNSLDLLQREVSAHMHNQLCECGSCRRSKHLLTGPTLANQHVLIQQDVQLTVEPTCATHNVNFTKLPLAKLVTS